MWHRGCSSSFFKFFFLLIPPRCLWVCTHHTLNYCQNYSWLGWQCKLGFVKPAEKKTCMNIVFCLRCGKLQGWWTVFGWSGLADDENDAWDKEESDHTETDSRKRQNELYCCGCQGYTSVIVLITAPSWLVLLLCLTASVCHFLFILRCSLSGLHYQ